MVVRRAETSDTSWLSGQLKQFSDFYGASHKLLNPEIIKGQVQSLIGSSSYLCLIAEHKGNRTGLVAGFVGPHPFNPEIRCLSELFWWVAPEYRKGRSAFMLLREFIKWGRTHVDWIIMSLLEKSELKPEVLKRWGFKDRERSFLMEVN